ncbi:MAG: M15 family metallopeptidase [Cyanobacteria bacterium SBLK]|nr:M15 family metallopeptidase [Cyanobacteria bacterium SBLK]
MRFWVKLRSNLLFLVALALIVLGLILNGYAGIKFFSSKTKTSVPEKTEPVIAKPSPTPDRQQPLQEPTLLTESPASSLASLPTENPENEPKFGHFPYPEGDRQQMQIIASYAQQQYQRFESLMPEAALALMKMIYAARDDRVWIVPVSGFRPLEYQEKLFHRQIKRLGSPEAAAKLSAPPGYSEHHTGYAIDLTDGNFPKQDITYKFAETDAFQWLIIHAGEFGFELSFPENNTQGINYEPWHWRFIGSSKAEQIFSPARFSP